MVVAEKFIRTNFPVHFLVWNDSADELEKYVRNPSIQPKDLETLDPHGRTPLLLAITMGHVNSALVLLKHGADATFEQKSGWNVVQEAVCNGDPELLKCVLEYRDEQKRRKRGDLVPNLLRRLKDAPDFYVEMKWEFTSWLPLVTRMCPGNTHRVYKMGSNVRVDSRVIGLDESEGRRGAVSVIFQGRGDCVKMMEIDHDTQQVISNVILSGSEKYTCVPDSRIYDKTVAHRLSNPAIISYVNLEKIAFERNKTGIWGWGSDKSEKVNNYDCKVFSATNVELVTKMRHEHLAESDKNRSESMSNFQRILSTFGAHESSELDSVPLQSEAAALNPVPLGEITAGQYFDVDEDLGRRDIGKPKEMRTKINKFKATVWLCENYPLNLPEQVMPIVDIMALSSTQFSKLRDFIQMQIPAGFPVKIEIPLFHLVNASITFHNIFGTEDEVRGVTYLQEESGRLSCVLDEDLFEPPSHYDIRKAVSPIPMTSSDDDLFQWAVGNDELASEASSRDHSTKVDIYEVLKAPRTLLKDNTPDSDAEEQLLQRAIEESLISIRSENPSWRPSIEETGGAAAALIPDRNAAAAAVSSSSFTRSNSFEELQAAIDMSRKEIEEADRLRKEEDDALKMALELSLREQ